MTAARWIDHDHIEVPARSQTGQTVGDGILTIGPDDADFDSWATWLASQNVERPQV